MTDCIQCSPEQLKVSVYLWFGLLSMNYCTGKSVFPDQRKLFKLWLSVVPVYTLSTPECSVHTKVSFKCSYLQCVSFNSHILLKLRGWCYLASPNFARWRHISLLEFLCYAFWFKSIKYHENNPAWQFLISYLNQMSFYTQSHTWLFKMSLILNLTNI